MFENYIKTAFRNILKTKMFSLINIFGLAIGMAAFLFILAYVKYQNSYDRFHKNADRIYRIRYERTDKDGQAVRFASCCPPAGIMIRDKLPEVEKTARIFRAMGSVSRDNIAFFEERIFFAEPEFMQIFDFKMLQGDRNNGIREPNTAFISASTAKKYFGGKNPIGEYFSVDKKTDYKVTGVFEDVPMNSHIKFDFLLSYKSLLAKFGADVEESWGDSGWFTYLLFRQDADISAFNKKLNKLLDEGINKIFKEYNLRVDLLLQPLAGIHLNSDFQQEYEVNGDQDTVTFLSVIAFLIILIAWVNYVNLSTSQSLSRAREVGLRKTVGASRPQLMVQFFFETILINTIAITITLLLVLLLMPEFNFLTGLAESYNYFTFPWFWLSLSGLYAGGIILSGLYPVLLLSSFKPAVVLKGKLGKSAGGFGFRKILVLAQFTLAIALITCTLAVFQQLRFMKSQDLGFNKENVLVIRAPRVRDASFNSKVDAFRDQALTNAAVNKFCFVTEVPGKQVLWDAGGIHQAGTENNKNYQIVGTDYDFATLFNLKFAAGRNFSRDFPADTSALILNETAAQWLGFKSPADAIGRQVVYWEKTYTVVGVLKDYRQQSLKNAFEPHIFRLMPYGRDVRGCMVLKFNGSPENIIAMTMKKYTELFPGNPFDYYFLEEYYNRQYKADELFGTIFGIFSFLAIFVTCLGVLGLSSYVVTQRTKEIGIRKVVGAGIFEIVFLFLKEYFVLIAGGFLLAFPLSYYIIDLWLQAFSEKMTFSFGIFVMPPIIVAVITAFTISAQIYKAAAADPVQSLRYE